MPLCIYVYVYLSVFADWIKPDQGGGLAKHKTGFYSASKFAVHKSLRKVPKPLVLPKDLLVSRNYFKTAWSLNTYRRVRWVGVGVSCFCVCWKS